MITSTAGLLQPDTLVTIEQLREWAAGDIDAGCRRYRDALDRDCGLLLERLGDSYEIVLLGSIATPKYVDPLLMVFGERLFFPAEFVGRGDMSRGGLMLRAVEAGTELPYAPVVHAIRHGSEAPAPLFDPASLPIPIRPRQVSSQEYDQNSRLRLIRENQ